MGNLKLKVFTLGMIACLTVFETTRAFAGNEKGNGGNVSVCFGSKATVEKIKKHQDNQIAASDLADIVSVQALDLDVALAHFSKGAGYQELVLPKPNENDIEFIERIASRFQYRIPGLTEKIRTYAKILNPKRFNSYDDRGLERIYDANQGFYPDPEKCVIATAIRQVKVGNLIFLDFDERLLSQMPLSKHSHESQVVLRLHEVLYRWALDLGQTDSALTQRLIAVLLRRDLSESDVFEALENFGFGNFRPEQSSEARFLQSIQIEIDQAVFKVVPEEIRKMDEYENFRTNKFSTLKDLYTLGICLVQSNLDKYENREAVRARSAADLDTYLKWQKSVDSLFDAETKAAIEKIRSQTWISSVFQNRMIEIFQCREKEWKSIRDRVLDLDCESDSYYFDESVREQDQRIL